MPKKRPCGRCERELPLSKYDHPGAFFCSACTQEAVELIRKKYGIIASAHFRAKLRYKTKQLKQKLRDKATVGV